MKYSLLFFGLISFSVAAQALQWREPKTQEFNIGEVLECEGSRPVVLDLYEQRLLNPDGIDVDAIANAPNQKDAFSIAARNFGEKIPGLGKILLAKATEVMTRIRMIDSSLQSVEDELVINGGPLVSKIFATSQWPPWDQNTCRTKQIYKVLTDPFSLEVSGILIQKQIWQKLDLLNKTAIIMQLAFIASRDSSFFESVNTVPIPKCSSDECRRNSPSDAYFLIRSFFGMGMSKLTNPFASLWYRTYVRIFPAQSIVFNGVECNPSEQFSVYEFGHLEHCTLGKDQSFFVADGFVVNAKTKDEISFDESGSLRERIFGNAEKLQLPLKESQNISIISNYLYFSSEGFLSSGVESMEMCRLNWHTYQSAKTQTIRQGGKVFFLQAGDRVKICFGEIFQFESGL